MTKPGSRRADLARLWRDRPSSAPSAVRLQALVAHVHFARLAVQFEEHRARAVRMRLADRQEFDHQRLAGLQFDRDLVAASPCRRRTAAWAALRRRRSSAALRANFTNTPDTSGSSALRRATAAWPDSSSTLAAVSSKSTGARCAPGRPRAACAPRRMIFCNCLGHPPSGSPSEPLNISITEFGQRQIVIRPQLLELLHGHAVGHQEDRHVADHLARRRDLHDVAEQLR